MKRPLVLLMALALVGVLQSSAFGAARYCGTGTHRTFTTSTTYVGAAWDRPGYRLMQTSRHFSATPKYYVCRPSR